MIFASVGSMLPFDRLVRAVDAWAGAHPDCPVFLQIGAGGYEPRHAAYARMVPQADYRARLRDCRLFVAHVGMGSILQALEERRQLLMLPRLHDLGEHTTDHQLHTAARFRDRAGLRIVDDDAALGPAIDELLAYPLPADAALAGTAPPPLLAGVARFLAAARPC